MIFLVVNPKYGIVFSLFFSIMAFVPLNIIFSGYIYEGILFLIFWAVVFFFLIIVNCFIRKIEISCKGVAYITLTKKTELSWSDISVIGIAYMPIKSPGRPPWIYFSADDFPVISLNPRMINDRFFMMNYRENVINEIRKYWEKEIKNLDKF